MEEIRNTCPFCERHFDNAKQVERHVKYVHRKPYQCDKCKRTCYTSRALEAHKKIHRPDYFFECKICHVKYKSEDGLKRHYIRAHSDYESRYICEHCGRGYKLKIDLTHHMKRTHISDLQICRFCGKKVKDVKGHEWRHQKRNREIKYEYPCHLCRKKFHHRSRLDNHLMLHEKGFKCEICGKEYSGTRELTSHKRFKHGQTNVSTCILCQKAFVSMSNFYQHVLTHASIRPYTCDVCEKDFTQRSSLLRHRKHHPGPLPPLSSSHPQIAELARNYLEKIKSDHIDKSFEVSLSNQLDPLSSTFLIVKLEDDYFRIPKSLSVFMMKEPPPIEENNFKVKLKEEEKIEKNNPDEKNQELVEAREKNEIAIDDLNDLDDLDDLDDAPLDFRKRRKNELSKTRSNKHTTNPKKKSHICQICHITFDRKSKLTSHMYKHSNSRPHKCTICSKGFKTSAYLSRHMEIHDEPAQLHACTLCEFKARTKPYLKIHYIRKHTEDYNYSCEQCGKMFKVQSDYTTHMKDHDTESCVCDICGTSYPSKSSLYFHKHYKHKTKIKEFECQVCRKRFKTQKNLDSHAELHKMKYVCEQCGMEFKFKYGLTKHLRTHSGEKSYLCAICGKTFGCLSSQKIHLLTHVGERPYVCDICGQSFTQRSPMMLHRKKHPGIHPPPPPIKITNLLHGVQDRIVVNKSAK
ncbi:PREDICTED: zinc finger protein 62 homolog [Cyphomyrmex costatus]|uniref:zinc finger protein 62 homolog n=1 Tax=Cyphomyrmex costatus TaxID=456900 RepID=UPI000852320F|nr:PREDICTED: zinc finger protein 62 homolog [Cyphomyrmex costatus]